MKGKGFLLGALAICLTMVVAGCGDSSKKEATNATAKTQATEKASAVPVTATDSSSATTTPKATKAPEKKKKLTKDEQVALDYFNIYINSSDTEARAKFVEEQVVDEMKPLFQLSDGSVADESEKMPSPEVKGNIRYTGDGTLDGRAILISNSEGKEAIVITSDGKYMITLFPDVEMTKETYDLARKQFKS
ncbi:hypothetical protein [Gorillibacterium massiliense]|uniref:hypothetical protein n=1 Tax=Gorillibacterium massiliense TaxID=1280390 RepID=UPI0004B43ED2|nr:hypothetical protein [Gorillibacterium massiliense]